MILLASDCSFVGDPPFDDNQVLRRGVQFKIQRWFLPAFERSC